MKKNYIKIASLIGVVVMLSSCLKTEELDSVKAMREAKVDNLKAGTAKLTADAAMAEANTKYRLAEVSAITIKNRYDSATNAYQLQIKQAESRYYATYWAAKAMADSATQLKYKQQAAYDLAVAEANRDRDIANAKYMMEYYKSLEVDYIQQQLQKVQDAKNSLLTAQKTFIERQEALYEAALKAKSDSINATLKNPAISNLYNDYFAYYNGGTLKSGLVINDGIFSLKQTILTDRNTMLLTEKVNKETQVKTNNDLLLTYKASLTTDSLDIVAQNKLIEIYTNSKTAANYDDAISVLEDLLLVAAADFQQKEIEWKKQVELLNEATDAYNVANTDYNNNVTKKNTAKSGFDAILNSYVLVPSKTYDGFLIKKSELAADFSDKQSVYLTWKNKFDAALLALNTAKTTKYNAQTRKDAADAAVAAATINGGAASQAQIDEQTAANTALTIAVTNLNTKQNDYDNIVAQYSTAETNYNNAKASNDTIIARDQRYLAYKAAYDTAVNKEVSLKSTKDAKLLAKNNQQAIVDAANTAQTNAKTIYNTYAGGKTSLEGLKLVTNNTIALSQLDSKIADAKKQIALENNSITDTKSKIARINDNLFQYDDAIEKLQQQIDLNQALVDEYEAAAAKVKAEIDKL